MESNGVRTFLCPNCGAPIRHGSLQCSYCGSGVYSEQAAEVTIPALAQAQKLIPEMQARIRKNPYDGDAYYQLGLACYTLKLYDQAQAAFEQAKRFSPGNALVHYFDGLALLRCAEPEMLSVQEFRIYQMRKEFEMALAIDPGFSEALLYRSLTDALLARNREDYAGALEPLKAVTSTIPDLGLGWRLLAACYFQTGDYRQAILAGKRAFQLDPTNQDVAYLVGAAHARLGEIAEMESWARRVADLRGDPESHETIQREFMGKID